MDENEVVELDLQLDSADAEKTLERLLEDADALGEIFKNISAEMSKLFGVLQKSLEAVLGIHIGDAELYRAVERYRDKRAVMHGTGW